MPFIYVPSGIVPADIFDYEAYRSSVELSAMEFWRWSLGTRNQLAEHYEAQLLADLDLGYTEAIVGASASALFVDNEASVLLLETGNVNANSIIHDSDKTFSLLGLGGQTLKMEMRFRISRETDIDFRMGMRNDDVDVDEVMVWLNSAGAPPIDDGVLRTAVDGGGDINVDANLASVLDLTLYHTYRLEMEPGVAARLYVDDVLVATQPVGGNVPVDMSYAAYFHLITRAASVVSLWMDYWKVWSE